MNKSILWVLAALAIIGCGGRYHRGNGTAGTSTTGTGTTGATADVHTVAALAFTNGATRIAHIVTFRTNKPSTLVSDVAVTGLDTVTSSDTSGPDQLAIIRRRPSTGGLYALSTVGTLYKINVTTGAATKVATVPGLVPANNFVSCMAFDPTTDQLRVVLNDLSNNDRNVRVNPDTGVVIATDTPFNRNGVTIANVLNALAYGPAGALYALENSEDQPSNNYEALLNVPNPNSGAVETFAVFPTVYYDGAAGFDISADGKQGIFVDADDQEVFAIDMATGAARSIGFESGTYGIYDQTYFDSAS